MKRFAFIAMAAAAMLCGCQKEELYIPQEKIEGQGLTFTATMEDTPETKATLDSENKCVAWEAGDIIRINGKSYSAQEAGTTTSFKAEGKEAEGPTYKAYFPEGLYKCSTTVLPSSQTYKAGKFDMPMYAESSTTRLQFKNLCAVLAIKVTSEDIATLKSIKVASDKPMCGYFTMEDGKAVVNSDGPKAVVLESPAALTLDEAGTTFYIAIPAQEYQYLNIFLSSDGTTYTQAMATKKAAGLGEIARNKMFSIDYARNATKLWKGNLFFADWNVGAKTATEKGGYYTWGGTNNNDIDLANHNWDYNSGKNKLSGNSDTATQLWGSNWRMPTSDEFQALLDNCEPVLASGLMCTGKGSYASNSVFLPDCGYVHPVSYSFGYYAESGSGVAYWTSSPSIDDAYYLTAVNGVDMYGKIIRTEICLEDRSRIESQSVRAVLDEEENPGHVGPEYPEGSRGTAFRTGDVDVNWVQLWEDGPKFAEYNVGATSENENGGYYCWGGNEEQQDNYHPQYYSGNENLSGEYDTATNLWGANWRMPSQEEFKALLANCTYEVVKDEYLQILGFRFKGRDDYSNNSIFLPDGGFYNENGYWNGGTYWSSTYEGRDYSRYLELRGTGIGVQARTNAGNVRAVLSDAPITRGKAKATIDGVDTDVKWIQLWENGPKFAEYNIGATSESECGCYYSWGGTKDKDERDQNHDYEILTGDTDTATKLWGSDWRMPAKEELEALIDNCVVEWTTVNDMKGCRFTGKEGIYTSNSIFLPAAGYSANYQIFDTGTMGWYWSSMWAKDDQNTQWAHILGFMGYDELEKLLVTENLRWNPIPIRAVLAE